MRAYIAHGYEPSEGAVLVFARTAREAKKLGWRTWWLKDICGHEYTTLRVRWLRDGADYHRDPEQEKRGEPYVVESPRVCDSCEMWYAEGLNADGLCECCVDGAPEHGP